MMPLTTGRGHPVDIVPAIMDAGDHPACFLSGFPLDVNNISHRNRIGGGNAVDLESTLHARLNELPGSILQYIPAAGRFIHACGHTAS